MAKKDNVRPLREAEKKEIPAEQKPVFDYLLARLKELAEQADSVAKARQTVEVLLRDVIDKSAQALELESNKWQFNLDEAAFVPAEEKKE